MEIWRDIPGLVGFYQASSLGRIRSLDRTLHKPEAKWGYPRRVKGRILVNKLAKGYAQVNISSADNIKAPRYVAHLVALAFIGPRPDGSQVCHNDGNRQNNQPENLRYGTKAENEADKIGHGTIAKGEAIGSSKLTETQVREIRVRAVTEPFSEIAARFSVSVASVSNIARGAQWGHLPLLAGEAGTPEGDAAKSVSLSARRARWAVKLNESRAGRVGK